MRAESATRCNPRRLTLPGQHHRFPQDWAAPARYRRWRLRREHPRRGRREDTDPSLALCTAVLAGDRHRHRADPGDDRLTHGAGVGWTKLVIDDGIGQSDMGLVLRYVLLLVAASVLTNGVTAVQTYLEQFVGQRVIYDLRNALYTHVQSQSMSFFDSNQSGQLMSRVTNDVNQVQFFLTQGLSRLTTTGVMVAFHLLALAAIDLPLTIVALLVTPVVVYYQRRMHGLMPMYRAMMEMMADLNVVIQENVSGIKLVKAYTRESYEAERFNAINQEIRDRRLTISRMMAFVMPGQEFAGQLSTIIVLVVGASRVMSGQHDHR